MTTGEGGVVVTDDDQCADLFRSLRNQGRGKDEGWLSHERLGYNYRLDEMSSALGVAQLERIEELLAKRAKVAEMYNRRLSGTEGVEVPYISPQVKMSWFLYVIRLWPEVDRERVMARLEEKGVPSRPYFPPIHLQPFYRERFGFQEGDFPLTERVSRSTLALPFYGGLDEESVDYVCEALKEAIVQR